MSSPLLFALASLIWGSTFWAITFQVGEVAPAVSVAYRFGLASALLFGWCLLRGDRLRLPWRAQRWMMLQGLATFAISYICTYSSEQYLVSALVAVLFALMVFWNPIANRIAFGHALTWRIWCAAALALSGVMLLLSHSLDAAWREMTTGLSGHFLLGLALAVTATIASTVGNILVIKVREHSSNVLLTTAWAMLWGTVAVTGWALLSGQAWHLPPSLSYWSALLYLSVCGSVIAFTSYFTLIARIGSQKAVYIGVVTPIISVLLSIQFEHYRPGPVEWIGMLLCLTGVAWAMRGDTPPPAITSNLPLPLTDPEPL